MSQVGNIEVIDEFLDFLKVAMPSSKKTTKTSKKVDPKADKLKVTQKKEIELWHHWNDNGRKKEHLTPLINSFTPLIQQHVNTWRSVEMPTSSIHSEFRKQFVNAVKTYTPGKSSLNTWVNFHLRKGGRYMRKYQNLGKIPEEQIKIIGRYDRAKEHLTNLHGYAPDTQTIADHLGVPVRKVAQLEKERRKDNPLSGYGGQDPAELYSPKELEALHLIKYDNRLSTEDRTVYEYTYGLNGKPMMAPGQISKTTGIHPSKISRIRTKLKGVLQEALEAL